MSGVPRLDVRGLSKTFSGVTVLENAHLALDPGEIHALVGQNGSGKSTLIKLISGVYRADQGGEILVDGEHLGPPVHAGRLHHQGLAFVHQDLGLVGDLTVRENVRVGRSGHHRCTRRIDKAADRAAVAQTFEFLGVPIDPEASVASLTPSERVAVAVARALQEREEGSGVIVFDESSRAIPHEALPAFYDMVRFLADQGRRCCSSATTSRRSSTSQTGSQRCATDGWSRAACRSPTSTRRRSPGWRWDATGPPAT